MIGCRVAAAAVVLVCVSSMALTMAADQAKANQAPKHSSVTVHCYVLCQIMPETRLRVRAIRTPLLPRHATFQEASEASRIGGLLSISWGCDAGRAWQIVAADRPGILPGHKS